MRYVLQPIFFFYISIICMTVKYMDLIILLKLTKNNYHANILWKLSSIFFNFSILNLTKNTPHWHFMNSLKDIFIWILTRIRSSRQARIKVLGRISVLFVFVCVMLLLKIGKIYSKICKRLIVFFCETKPIEQSSFYLTFSRNEIFLFWYILII